MTAGKTRFDPNYRPIPFEKMIRADDRYDEQLIENCQQPTKFEFVIKSANEAVTLLF
jgi:hypothetical protein